MNDDVILFSLHKERWHRLKETMLFTFREGEQFFREGDYKTALYLHKEVVGMYSTIFLLMLEHDPYLDIALRKSLTEIYSNSSVIVSRIETLFGKLFHEEEKETM